MYTKIAKISIIALCFALICSCTGQRPEQQTAVSEASGSFYISVLKVGKADAIILRTENHAVLIDTGERGDGAEILQRLESSGIKSVDYLFITHFDKDHVGGAVKLLNNMDFGEIVTPDYGGTGEDYLRFASKAEEKGIKPTSLTESMTFALDDVSFEVYPPLKAHYDEGDNDFSLAISVTHGDNTFLFTGDAETERLRELYGQLEFMEHDFIKVPHHGNSCSISKDFLGAVSPAYAVITCSDKNPPDGEILNILDSLGCETYLTSKGDVELVSDGSSISVTQAVM